MSLLLSLEYYGLAACPLHAMFDPEKDRSVKERLNIKNTVRLTVKPTGLNYTELRAMVNLRPKKYSELTTDQLITLRNKVLFRLENEVQYHASQWEERMRQIVMVADKRGITLEN